MKKKVALLLCAVFSVIMPFSAFADGINVFLNDDIITFSNTQPMISEGRTLVPLRGVFDAMGYKVEWDAEDKTAFLSKGDVTIETSEEEMYYFSPTASWEIKCDVLPKIINGSFMVPLRSISEATGAEIEWEAETKSVYITAKNQAKSGEGKVEGKMSVDEKEYIDSLKTATDCVYKFASEKNDSIFKAILFEYNNDDEFVSATVPDGYYNEIQEQIDKLKTLEPPEAMSGVHDCVFEYLDVIQSVVNKVKAGTYSGSQIEADKKKLRQVSQDFGVKLYKYFKDNNVNFEMLYGAEILDALKRN